MIREAVEVGGGPAHEGLGLQGGMVQGRLDERMNHDVAGCLIVWIWSSRKLWSLGGSWLLSWATRGSWR